MELFTKINNGFEPLTILPESFIVDAWLSSEKDCERPQFFQSSLIAKLQKNWVIFLCFKLVLHIETWLNENLNDVSALS